jgi:hypothetical protein
MVVLLKMDQEVEHPLEGSSSIVRKADSMDRHPAVAGTGTGPVLAGNVVGHGLFRLVPQNLQAVRKRPGPVSGGWERVSPSLLRYSDEQTVAGVAAVFSAMEGAGLEPGRLEPWGVVAASRFVGRANLAQALRSYDAEGVWGVSPHLIPHFALHSPSGTISLALGLRGPNLGVGGGLHSAAEGFLAALTWLSTGVVPGVWLVLSGWSPELVPGQPNVECQALALALVAAGPKRGLPTLRVKHGPRTHPGPGPIDLLWLSENLGGTSEPTRRTIATDASGQLHVELVRGRRQTTEGVT